MQALIRVPLTGSGPLRVPWHPSPPSAANLDRAPLDQTAIAGPAAPYCCCRSERPSEYTVVLVQTRSQGFEPKTTHRSESKATLRIPSSTFGRGRCGW
ncbi:hexokinase-2-like [Iris pallida]|uniref:Hexokinase-2-like n=1 Tax=Iris pallida TaxID=29817 RepID=A0AAX6G8N5_IRIPA|nr:hexokinase-2-like [Iris pallida]